MNYILALLAFAAIMIVLATLVTVVVSFTQSLFSMRAKSFNIMLTQLYDNEIAPRLKNLDVTSKVDEFISQLVTNPAISKDKGWLDKLPLFNRNFDQLNTRQFIEQFRDTAAGKAIQTKITDKAEQEIQSLITEISYEFERYGEATKTYFGKRAMLISILVSLIFAITLNIDALRLYETLSKDDELSKNIVSQIDIDKLEQAYIDSVQAVGSDKGSEEIRQKFQTAMESVNGELGIVTGSGLPIGHTYYPYCSGIWSGTASLNNIVDSRCLEIASFLMKWDQNDNMSNTENTAAEGSSGGTGRNSKSESVSFVGKIYNWLKHLVQGVFIVFTTDTGWVWLIRALLSGALIGLGAPFWFKAYKFIAEFVPQVGAPAAHSSQQRLASPQLANQSGVVQTTASKTPQHGLTGANLMTIFQAGKGS